MPPADDPEIPQGTLQVLPRSDGDANNPALAYIAGLTQRLSQITMASTLVLIAATIMDINPSEIPNVGSEWPIAKEILRQFPWGQLREQHVVLLRNRLRAPDPRRRWAPDGYSDVFLNKVLVAIRQVSHRARLKKLMSPDAYEEIRAIKRIKVTRVPAGRLLSVAELTSILEAARAQAPNVAARDLAILSILMGTGCRRDEIASLKLFSFDAKAGVLTLRGKGNKQRAVPINDFLKTSISAWIAVRGTEPGPLFFRMLRNDVIDHRRGISANAIFYVIHELSKAAGIDTKDRLPSPHDFRRTFITLLLGKGVDLIRVAKIVGHESIETTRIYDYRPIEEQREATAIMDSILKGEKT